MDLGRELVRGYSYPGPEPYPASYPAYLPLPSTQPQLQSQPQPATTPVFANGVLLGTYGPTNPYRRIAPALPAPAPAMDPSHGSNTVNPVHVSNTIHPMQGALATRDRFQCSLPGCNNRMFARLGDLQRHAWSHHEIETRERDTMRETPKAIWRCDYRRCARSLTPFYRLDHYRDHLRDQHREDLPRRRTRPDAVWWSQRNPHCVVEGWWRCNKCLVVRVNTERHGYVCPGCGVAIDAQRRTYRESLLAGTQVD